MVSGFHYGLSCFRMAEKIWSWQRIIKGITNNDFVSDQHKTFFQLITDSCKERFDTRGLLYDSVFRGWSSKVSSNDYALCLNALNRCWKYCLTSGWAVIIKYFLFPACSCVTSLAFGQPALLLQTTLITRAPRSKYCLEFSFAWGRLNISRWTFHLCTSLEAYLINFLRFSEVTK